MVYAGKDNAAAAEPPDWLPYKAGLRAAFSLVAVSRASTTVIITRSRESSRMAGGKEKNNNTVTIYTYFTIIIPRKTESPAGNRPCSPIPTAVEHIIIIIIIV